jgi:type II secretory pathway component PulF
MPAFRYEAVDAGGASKKGVLNADSARSARAELRAGTGAARSRCHRRAGRCCGAARSRGLGERLSATELALFTRQLASLLEAGLPLEQAFTALLEQAERNYVRDLIASSVPKSSAVRRCPIRWRATRATSPKSTVRWWPRASRSASCRACYRAWPTTSNGAMR